MLKKEGLELLYHNHSREFLPNDDGIITHEELQKRTEIGFEIDTFWAFAAGVCPVSLMEKLKDRLPVIHLKDGLKDGEGKHLGKGEAPVTAVREKAIELGCDIVVESEGLDPNGIEEVASCFNFLKTLN